MAPRKKKGKKASASKAIKSQKPSSCSSCGSSSDSSSSSKDEKRDPKRKKCDRGGPHIQPIGQPVIKSPLDTHGYKMVQLPENELRGLLISTCVHPLDPCIEKKHTSSEAKDSCIFNQIVRFNEAHVNLKTRCGSAGSRSNDVAFSRATKEQEKNVLRKRQQRKFTGQTQQQPTKCNQGVHELDDEMQNFCNNKCIAVLYIKAGFFNDPQDVPGMAHFCEHAISLGSKNFPEVEAFTKFVETRGGFSNARTEEECTVYYFYVDADQIGEALEMFVDMFANPVFTSDDNISREIDNLNSEFESKRWVDELRFRALIKACAKDGHPITSFGMGSASTLKVDRLKDRLIQWIVENYCAEKMFFAIQGPKALPELELLFGKFCCKFPPRCRPIYKNVPAPPSTPCKCGRGRPSKTTDQTPFQMKQWHKLYHVAGSATCMLISWAVDPRFGKNFKTKPINYLSYILYRKGEGSLMNYLIHKGWIMGLTVNLPEATFHTTEYYTIVTIQLELTKEGFEKRMTVLKTVLQYIQIIREAGPSLDLFNEIRQLQCDIFHYRSDMNLSDPTIGRRFDELVANDTLFYLLHTYAKTSSEQNILLNTYLVTDYDEALLKDFVDSLTVQTMMVIFSSKEFESKAKLTEKWYNTKYFTKPICPEFLSEVENGKKPTELRFPGPNPFLSGSLCFPESEVKRNTMKEAGLLIYENAKGQVYFENKSCRRGLLPSSQYIMEFASPVLEDDMDMFNTPSIDLLIYVMKYIVDWELSEALSSLISCEYDIISGCDGCIRISLCGPSPKLPRLAQIVMNTVQNFAYHVSKRLKLVDDLKTMLLDNYDAVVGSCEDCGNNLLNYVISRKSFFISDYIYVLKHSYNGNDFLFFARDFQTRLRVDADLIGCVTQRQASEFAEFLDSELNFIPYNKPQFEQLDNVVMIPFGERCLLVAPLRAGDGVVFVLNYYQVGPLKDPIEVHMLTAITAYLSETVFEELRTKSSLGYHVEAGLVDKAGAKGIKVVVLGAADKHTTGYINERIDQFMEDTYEKCLTSPKKFEEHILPWLSEDVELNFKDTQKFYSLYFPCKHNCLEGIRKLTIQIQGEKKSSKSKPMQPELLDEKIQKYRSSVKRKRCGGCEDDDGSCGVSRYSQDYVKLNLKNVHEENGYYITDVHKFKNAQPCFANLEHVKFDESDSD